MMITRRFRMLFNMKKPLDRLGNRPKTEKLNPDQAIDVFFLFLSSRSLVSSRLSGKTSNRTATKSQSRQDRKEE